MKIQMILAKDANMNRVIKTMQIENVKDNNEVAKIAESLKSVYGARFASWYRV